MSLIGIIILAVLSLSLVGYAVVSARLEKRSTLSRRLKSNKSNLLKNRAKEATAKKWLKEKAAPVLAKSAGMKSASDQSNLRIRMANAGIRTETAPVIFLASKTVLAGLFTVISLTATIGAGNSMQKIVGITMFVAALGFLLPEVWIRIAAASRARKITHGLPDCLDLMVVSVEAGLGLDSAIQRVGHEMSMVHPELSEEFQLTVREIQMGIQRGEALTNLALRTNVPELRSLTAMLIQAERFGTSIAGALRRHAESLRTKRRQKAEEKAAKTAVKLILPLILFIFPTIFIVLAGPAVLKAVDAFTSGAMGGSQ